MHSHTLDDYYSEYAVLPSNEDKEQNLEEKNPLLEGDHVISIEEKKHSIYHEKKKLLVSLNNTIASLQAYISSHNREQKRDAFCNSFTTGTAIRGAFSLLSIMIPLSVSSVITFKYSTIYEDSFNKFSETISDMGTAWPNICKSWLTKYPICTSFTDFDCSKTFASGWQYLQDMIKNQDPACSSAIDNILSGPGMWNGYYITTFTINGVGVFVGAGIGWCLGSKLANWLGRSCQANNALSPNQVSLIINQYNTAFNTKIPEYATLEEILALLIYKRHEIEMGEKSNQCRHSFFLASHRPNSPAHKLFSKGDPKLVYKIFFMAGISDDLLLHEQKKENIRTKVQECSIFSSAKKEEESNKINGIIFNYAGLNNFKKMFL